MGNDIKKHGLTWVYIDQSKSNDIDQFEKNTYRAVKPLNKIQEDLDVIFDYPTLSGLTNIISR